MANIGDTQVLTADGNSETVSWTGGKGTYSAHGTFGSGTAKLQMTVDGSTWFDVGSGASFTANDAVTFNLPPCDLRVNLSGSTTPSISAIILRAIRRLGRRLRRL